MQEESVKSINKLRELVEAGEETGERRFIRCKQAVETYHMGKTKVLKVARDAGALYKLERVCLIDEEIFEAYIRTFKVPPGIS